MNGECVITEIKDANSDEWLRPDPAMRWIAAIVADRNSPQKHVWRARGVLLTADGLGTAGIMRQTSKSKSVVWRWQERFMRVGVDGLLRDKTRPSRKPPLDRLVIARVIDLTAGPPPGEATHRTAAAMAKAASISVSSVRRIWRAPGLKPHQVRQFKLSNDPAFAAKLKDVVGFYVDPPAHAVVLSIAMSHLSFFNHYISICFSDLISACARMDVNHGLEPS